jgi:6-phosphogluconolactonase
MRDASPIRSLPRLVVVDTDAVSGAAAEVIAQALTDAIAARGVAHWATTGGSAAPGIYRGLGASPLREQVDWTRVHTWWGDDRFVPWDHPLSNVLPLEEVLLPLLSDAGLAMPVERLHRWPIPQAIALAEDAAWVATRYAAELEEALPADAGGSPVLDLVVLGVGPDGHVLSVFPGSPAWDAPESCVAVPAPTHIEPHVERVTLHPRLLAAARSVLVVTAGASKAAGLGRAWTGDDARELPVRAARLGTATWILDEAAAAELPLDRLGQPGAAAGPGTLRREPRARPRRTTRSGR